ncbi:hypothetical protein PUN28_008564 [Cardiocondyla obscurior]|uniref:Uncharacterized protein n=1 Tax=Cardiocondyla obscurior TaxID=286306 RepID=A0AAW2G065_9HYME
MDYRDDYLRFKLRSATNETGRDTECSPCTFSSSSSLKVSCSKRDESPGRDEEDGREIPPFFYLRKEHVITRVYRCSSTNNAFQPLALAR